MDSVDERWWRIVLAGPVGTLSSNATVGTGEHYSTLPRPGDPRVVVDLDCPRAMSDAIDRMVSSRTSNAVARRAASSVSSLAGRRKPDWIVSSDGELGSLRQYLSEVLGREVRISVSVGPPRPNRKPVVRCYSQDELIAVAKLGPDDHTRQMVQNEAEWLTHLMGNPLDGVVTPGLLYSGTYGSSALLVMEPLDLVDDLGVTVAQMPMATLVEFVSSHVDETARVRDTPWFAELPTRLGEDQYATLRPTFDEIVSDPFFDDLEVSAWHGDWSPWNTGRVTNGQLAVWDWERTMVGVPTGFDLLHLHYQYGSGLDGATLGLASFGIPTAHHRPLRGLYLLELCARHAEADALETPRHAAVSERLTMVLS